MRLILYPHHSTELNAWAFKYIYIAKHPIYKKTASFRGLYRLVAIVVDRLCVRIRVLFLIEI